MLMHFHPRSKDQARTWKQPRYELIFVVDADLNFPQASIRSVTALSESQFHILQDHFSRTIGDIEIFHARTKDIISMIGDLTETVNGTANLLHENMQVIGEANMLLTNMTVQIVEQMQLHTEMAHNLTSVLLIATSHIPFFHNVVMLAAVLMLSRLAFGEIFTRYLAGLGECPVPSGRIGD